MSADRLQALQSELKTLLDERVAELRRLLDETEDTTRRIVSAELDIDRSRRYRESLDEELSRIAADVKALGARTDETQARHAARVAERDNLREQLLRMEAGLDEINGEIGRLHADQTRMDKQLERLSAEQTELERKNQLLDAEIDRRRKLAQELRGSLQENMQKLNVSE